MAMTFRYLSVQYTILRMDFFWLHAQHSVDKNYQYDSPLLCSVFVMLHVYFNFNFNFSKKMIDQPLEQLSIWIDLYDN